MSIPFSGRSTPLRALALISAGAVVAGTLGGVPTATAARDSDAAVTKQAPARELDAGRYVVILREPGATRYEGGVKGLGATKSPAGNGFNARSEKVADYSSYLATKQNRLAAQVGVEVQSNTTLASNAFTSRLSAAQATDLSSTKDVLMLVKDVAFKTDTWNTPRFLGLEGEAGAAGVWQQQGGVATAGAGTVVGVLDSGIWPESASFAGGRIDRNPNTATGLYRHGNEIFFRKADGGVFRGYCEPGEKWVPSRDCNSKIVGARYYPEAFLDSVKPQDRDPFDYKSTRDNSGHGSHTASTAAGNNGVNVTVEGTNFGNVSGMAPAAKIAAYKVCFDDTDPGTGGCYTSSTLDAVDDAIADGVDVINYSISGATDTVVDAVEYAFLGAAAAGVFVATSAGNSGPDASTVAHNSPWVTTVAASTHVNFENTVVLGNGQKYKGASISKTALPQTPLVSSTAAGAAGADANQVRLCYPGTLNAAVVAGKIVVCQRGDIARVDKSAAVEQAGGVGMILVNITPNSLDADFHAVPTVHLGDAAAPAVLAYAATSGATAAFELGDTTGGAVTPIPQIAGFSSRGPAIANESDVIKPDISAPGVSVLAAVAPPTNSGRDYDLYSGTSMSSPHIAGLAAFILGENPEWTPMTVKSAMMTTAYDLKKEDGTADQNPFNQGAGHVDPTRFFNPGLVVTSGEAEWLSFFEGQGFDFGPGVDPMAASDLNIPSIANGQVVGSKTISRTFTALEAGTWNIAADVPGFQVTTDKSQVAAAAGDSVKVAFTFTRTDAPLDKFATGFVTLTGPTTVRMPVALRPASVVAPAEVRGEGVDGFVPVTITPGFTGTLDITPSGLAGAFTLNDTVATGADFQRPVTIADGTKLARFDLDAIKDAADLDLYVYKTDAAGVPTKLVGQSATGAADESVDLTAPTAGSYLVVIDGYAAAPGESTSAYRYDEFLIGGTGLGGLAADPSQFGVVQGTPVTYNATWSGLTAGRYLGYFEYTSSTTRTYLYVDVP